jgi:hypothetical protein
MSNGSEAFWTSYELVWGVLTADEEHSVTYCLDCKPERLVVFFEKSQ